MTKLPTLRRVPASSVAPRESAVDQVRRETERLQLWLESWAASMSNDRGAVQAIAGRSSLTVEGRESATNYMTAEDDGMVVNDLRARHQLRELSDAIDSLMQGQLWAWWTIYRFHGLRRKQATLWTFAALEADLPAAYARALEQLRIIVNHRGLAL